MFPLYLPVFQTSDPEMSIYALLIRWETLGSSNWLPLNRESIGNMNAPSSKSLPPNHWIVNTVNSQAAPSPRPASFQWPS